MPNIGWTKLLTTLGLDANIAISLIQSGYLPQGGPDGWDVDECRLHLGLAFAAQDGEFGDEWRAAAEALADLNRLSNEAIEAAQAAPSKESIDAAAKAGNRFFRLYNLFAACIGHMDGVDPSYKRGAFEKALFDYDDTLARLLRDLDGRASARFLQ